ncbi:hypothetical protein IQ254_04185 [Nodosilinea sp. LEGE 07088]|uniref:hypothetical protein n=1 Tax=Nodosilinea sp. LEGE 07088 TaxID=2777968 RepID=UPI0018804346|nr:hypothetical protein [Nodosilinea sp. LEGE 07088]MBE9136407.1 hypothetical protein [Nodosilinea sp. LEGE 07088]
MPMQHNTQIGRVLRAAKLTIAMMLLIWGCSRVGQSLPTTADCATDEAAFELHLNSEAVNCTADFLEVTATGLPDLTSGSHEDVPMIGITSWIQRVAVPYDYHWRIPLAPDWLAEPVEASARGPIAVAVDGVPIFHIEPRPFDALAQRTPSPLGGSYGEPVSTLITDFEKNEDGDYRLAFDSLTTSGVTSSILYRQTSEDCWEFEYQTVAGESGQTTEACRHSYNRPE